ncbi:MAG TPA: hypothetical protein VKA64_02855 [Gammaproteobacteria bacterium]|nr:hypothetical protein [Gammaproteobacteria bacterium]
MFRTILLTFTATTAALGLAGSLFLNTLLGSFGLVATSVETMRGLQASKQVVETLKDRHHRKRLKAGKRFAKRTTKRVASGAVAAATIGTVAVAITMTTMEVNDYCDEKRELQKEANILYGEDVAFDWEQCYEEGKEDAKMILADAKGTAARRIYSVLGYGPELD